MKLTFLGGTGTVTGSKYLLEVDGRLVLVDCGLFQGYKKLRLRNWSRFPVEPGALDAVVLTHAHIDHSGYVPRLCATGFDGPIYCTPGTADLLRILLPDSGYLQEEQARHANKWGYSKHRPASPLYTREQAERSLAQLVPVGYGEPFEVAGGVRATFSRAGHIVGSACVAVNAAGTTIGFSGDVGRPVDPIMKPPDPMPRCDYLVVESTYGDRSHPAESVHEVLADLVNEMVEARGTLVVPSFAVGRSQHLLHLMAQLQAQGRIPEVPVYLDSPMAINATKLFCKHTADHRLTAKECEAMCAVASYSRTADESKAISRSSGPMVIISASGMVTGGRVLHHLRRFLPEPKNAVLFVGYQASGTRGRALVDGADELKMHGQYVRIQARVRQVQGLSAHADYRELLEWLTASELEPQRVFVTHGEPGASDAMRRRISDALGWDAVTPDDGTSWELGNAKGGRNAIAQRS